MTTNVFWEPALHKDDLDRLAHIPAYHEHVACMCKWKFKVGIRSNKNKHRFKNDLAEMATDLYCLDEDPEYVDFFVVRFSCERDAMTFKMTDWSYLTKV